MTEKEYHERVDQLTALMYCMLQTPREKWTEAWLDFYLDINTERGNLYEDPPPVVDREEWNRRMKKF